MFNQQELEIIYVALKEVFENCKQDILEHRGSEQLKGNELHYLSDVIKVVQDALDELGSSYKEEDFIVWYD